MTNEQESAKKFDFSTDESTWSESQIRAYIATLPNWRSQITIRGVLVAILVGTVLTFISMRLNLMTSPIFPSFAVPSALMAYVVMKVWTRIFSQVLPFTKQENTIIQTMAVSIIAGAQPR